MTAPDLYSDGPTIRCLVATARALLMAGRGFAASAVNYGMLPKDLDGVLDGACPVVASSGGKDRMLKGAASTLETGLTRAGVAHDVKEYLRAGHAFLNDAMNGPQLLRPRRSSGPTWPPPPPRRRPRPSS